MDLSGKRILIIKPSSLGDIVHTLPVVHAIKRGFPTCVVAWVIQKSFRGVLENDPDIDEIIPIDIPSTSDPSAPRGVYGRALRATVSAFILLRKRCRKQPFDYVLDLHASLRSGVLALANPDGARVGFADAKEFNTLFQHTTLGPPQDKPHAVDKNLVFADFLGCTAQPDDFRIVTGIAERDRIRSMLKEKGIRSGDRIVYANPAARWATKYWTPDGWAELADLIVGNGDAHLIFAGSPADSTYIADIIRRMTHRPIDLSGKLSLAEAAALLEISDCYVGVDSGPMHMAAFTGTRVIALFGPTDPAKVGPYGDGHLVLRQEDLDCLACRKRSCTDRRCLEDITGGRVYAEMKKHLEW